MKLSKQEKHAVELQQYAPHNHEMASYLSAHSNLPGKRANLELAFAFADYVEERYASDPKQVLMLCTALIANNPPCNHAVGHEEFLALCGIVGMGRIGKIDPLKEPHVLEQIKRSAEDKRWRVREAVAMAIQDLMDARPEAMLATLQTWVREESFLLHRAAAAGVAEPRFMSNRKVARAALDLHREIFEKMARVSGRPDPDCQVLVKGLCYTLSVVITGMEQDGFAYLETLLETDHPVFKKIVLENLKKKRLTRLNAGKVVELQQKLKK